MKARTQAFLRRIGLYQRLKFSVFYDLYWGVMNPGLIENRSKEVKFFRNTLVGLKHGDLIFDVGANLGQKTDIFLRLGARVVAVDPDESNQETLRRSFLCHRLVRKPVTIVGKALSDHVGAETMWIDQPGSAKNTLNSKWVDTLRHDSGRFGQALQFDHKREVQTITLEELIRSHGLPIYIKIDVEGHEVSVLRGLRSVVPYISFEVNLPEFKPEAQQCIDLLEGLGPGGGFNYALDCLGSLALEDWLPRATFMEKLDLCEAPSIEVFWKAPSPRQAASRV